MNMESKGKKRTFLDSVKNCLDGISYTFGHENNFKREIFIGILVVIASIVLKISLIEWIIVILMICFVLVFELINTALEKTVDLYTTKYNETAKVIKDVAGASVFVMCMFSAVVGVIIFLPKIINLIK